ncbi:MAG TPA: cytochrome c [Anaerolineales bacterium]|nr:cytochrome c [Anaerolineales bacterium]
MKVTRTILLLGLLAGAVVLAACGGGQPAATEGPAISAEAQKYASLVGDATAGKQKLEGTCSSCHGPDAKGISGLGKDLTTSEYAIGLPDAELILFLAKGRPASDSLNTTGVDMPPRGGNPALTDQDLADIVAYVRTLEK